MTLGIYKPTQGYWVRVLTATLIGVLALAASAWIYGQMGLVAEKLPRSVWAMSVSQSAVQPTPGQPVTLLGKSATPSEPGPEIGTGVVESFNNAAGELRIKDVQMRDSLNYPDPGVAAAIRVGAGSSIPTQGARGETAINPLLIQGVAMAIVLLIGSLLAYYTAGVHQRFVDFLIATDGEMKKVNWSTGRDIRMSTLVVIFASVMLAACLFAADFGFQWFFKTIGILAQ